MAAIAVGAVIDIITYPAMFVVCGAGRMASCGAAEYRVVGRVRVAGEARDTFVGAGCDGEPCVIEGGTRPLGCCVACRTRRREARGCVVRIRRRIVDRAVTAVAIRRRSFENAVYMAGRAGHGRVLTS